jgi:hypothetical protein
MKLTKRQKLEAAGWKVGTFADFLQLSLKEIELIEMRKPGKLTNSDGRAQAVCPYRRNL